MWRTSIMRLMTLSLLTAFAMSCHVSSDDVQDEPPARSRRARDKLRPADKRSSDAAKKRQGAVKPVRYTTPLDACAVADPSLLPSEAGAVIDKAVETEGTTLPITGCSFMLRAPDGINTFKIFVAAGDDATAQFDKSDEAWKSAFVPGFRTEAVAGLGARAFFVVRLTAENRRVDSVLFLQDHNLYLEVRFLGGGAKEWDESSVRNHLVGVARDAMTKLAKT